MPEHSPTPWRIDGETIYDADGAVVYDDDFRHDSDSGRPLETADLQFIVTCVNRCAEFDAILSARWETLIGATHHHDSDQHDYRFTRQVPQSGAWIFECECGDSIARFGERGQTPPVGSPP